MGLRKGHCYSDVKRSYTRKSKVRSKSYIKTIPPNKIIRYIMGESKKSFDVRLNLIARGPVQVRHNALESCRQVVNRKLTTRFGSDYIFMLRVYPHHILRENRMLTGAGADRMQRGMQLSFGQSIGLAAQIKKGQAVFSVDVRKEKVDYAKKALHMAVHRMPGQYTIVVEHIKH